MNIIPVLFYLLAGVTLFSGLMVVLAKNPVRAILFLVLAFFASAGLWLLLEAEFLALILVLVYVGAVMTLFLFVVMMLNVDVLEQRRGFVSYLPIAVCVALLVAGLTINVLGPKRFGLLSSPPPESHQVNYSNIANLGDVLYTDFAYPFEISALILLTAIIAAISLTHRRPKGRKQQNTAAQIAVRPEDRVKLIKMASEKKPQTIVAKGR